jgi:hypothetical protein
MAKMGTMNKLVLILLALLAAGGCAAMYYRFEMSYNDILEPDGVDHFKVEELSGTHPTRLTISARLLFSGAGIRNIAEKKNGPTIIVLVHLAGAGRVQPKTSGRLEYEMTVPDSVNEVRFGRSSTLIWKRGSSSTRPPT